MSAPKSITVSRAYNPAPDACLRALITLLKRPVNHEGSPSPAALASDGTKIKEASADGCSIPE